MLLERLMDDEEKKFVNEEEEEEKEEKKESGNESKIAENKNRLTQIIAGIFNILLLPIKLLFKVIKKYPKFFLVIFLLLAAIAGTVYVARTRPEILGIPVNETDSVREVDDLISEVSRLIKLPENEVPTIATVTDAEKLSGQSFFASAQNGDKVLIYSNAKKIYLYRPSEKRIIEASIIDITQKEEVVTETPVPSSGPTPTGR